MQNNALPIGFISVNDAIDLINSDTRANAKVDTAFLLRNLPYLRVDGNYTIKKLRHENGRIVADGQEFVHISSEYERSILEHAITEHYRNVTGKIVNVEAIGLRSMTTAVDDEKNANARVMVNDKPLTKLGDTIVDGGVEKVVEE